MKTPHPCTVDFETFEIQGRPDYPPAPVGVAIKKWGKKGKYYAFGHPSGNNCNREQAQVALSEAYKCSDGILCHHAKFDTDVADVHMGLRLPEWDMVQDTTFLSFLNDPHARSVGLKETAHRLLGMPPEERDAVAEWLVANQPVPGVRIKKSDAGKYIAYAPGDIVGPYAIGDCERTELLFAKLFPDVCRRGMEKSYDRERRLVPILLDMERRGIRVDLQRLRDDTRSYSATLSKMENWVRKRLNADDLNLDSGAQLVAALDAAGLADMPAMGLTKTGKVSTNKAALAAGVKDAQLAGVLQYISQLGTCLRTFMEPWLAVAERSSGLIFTNWNQIRGGDGGTRTGRFSSTPNLQNIPQEFKPIFTQARGDGLPKAPFKVPPLPLCRGYVLPYDGHVLIDRDFASQELRLLAHFVEGPMLQTYLDKPDTDFHQHAADILLGMMGARFAANPKDARKKAKTIGFAILYGAGLKKLAAQLGTTYDEAKKFLDAYLGVFPSIREIQKDMRARGKAGEPIRTAGGREYYCQPPAIVDGQLREFSYKQLNYLIQGSAADQTKDTMIRFYDRVGPGYLLASVHDQIPVSAPADRRDEMMRILRDCMAETELDVPMLSDGKWGATWGSLERSEI